LTRGRTLRVTQTLASQWFQEPRRIGQQQQYHRIKSWYFADEINEKLISVFFCYDKWDFWFNKKLFCGVVNALIK